MIFNIGDEVTCIDDSYAEWAFRLYKELPIKGMTYTVRNTSIGRASIEDSEFDSLVHSILLNEIHNPIDPHYRGGQEELRFDTRHFKLLQEAFAESQIC